MSDTTKPGPQPKPVENCYWVVEGRLLAGEYPSHPRAAMGGEAMVQSLLDFPVTHFIDLTEPNEGLDPYHHLLAQADGVRAERFAIRDADIPRSFEEADAIVAAIDRALAADRRVYVHCRGGIGRTGVAVGCWLAHHHRESGAEALDRLSRLWKSNPKSKDWPESPETKRQALFIRDWARSRRTAETATAGPRPPQPNDRARGCLLGQLAGDSLGSLVEFLSAASIKTRHPNGVRLLADGGTYDTLAGQPTDDSEMALALARSLREHGAFHTDKVRSAYRSWAASGPFDIGTTTRSGLAGRPNPESQANGGLMRISPLGIFCSRPEISVDQMIAWARDDAGITHVHPVCRDSSAVFVRTIALAIRHGLTADEAAATALDSLALIDAGPSVRQAVERGLNGERPASYEKQMGFVLIALQNAFYQLALAPSLEEGVIDTVGRGGDTDTNAAICGALLGAVHGESAIPSQWREAILSCRPKAGGRGVHKPRPEIYWPVDAIELADALVASAAV
jgi:ADP-ribosylglycohydrolase